MKLRLRSMFWLTIGIVFILLDPILAHLSNAGLIRWPKGWDDPKVTRIVSRILIGCGILFLVVAYFKLRSERSEKSNSK